MQRWIMSSSRARTATISPSSLETRAAQVVFGLAAIVNITGAEAANDRLTINALAGDDVVEASGSVWWAEFNSPRTAAR